MQTDRSTLVLASSALTSIPDAAFASDQADGRIIGWNAAATELTGFQRREALARTCGSLLDGVDDLGQPVCSVDCPYRGITRSSTAHEGAPGAAERLPGTCTTWDRHPDMRIRTATGWRRVVVITLPALVDGEPAMLHVLRAAENAHGR